MSKTVGKLRDTNDAEITDTDAYFVAKQATLERAGELFFNYKASKADAKQVIKGMIGENDDDAEESFEKAKVLVLSKRLKQEKADGKSAKETHQTFKDLLKNAGNADDSVDDVSVQSYIEKSRIYSVRSELMSARYGSTKDGDDDAEMVKNIRTVVGFANEKTESLGDIKARVHIRRAKHQAAVEAMLACKATQSLVADIDATNATNATFVAEESKVSFGPGTVQEIDCKDEALKAIQHLLRKHDTKEKLSAVLNRAIEAGAEIKVVESFQTCSEGEGKGDARKCKKLAAVHAAKLLGKKTSQHGAGGPHAGCRSEE
jgi:hypothetical protein